MAYNLTTKKTWAETRDDLAESMDKWGVTDWNIIPPAGLKPSQMANTWGYYDASQRAVAIRWVRPQDHREIRLAMSEQARPVDNLRVLYLVVESMRMNEARGIGRVVQEAYAQLAGPTLHRDPYEVLGLRADAALEVAEGAYKALAKLLHPDTNGGDGERMKELNAAIAAIREERKAEDG